MFPPPEPAIKKETDVGANVNKVSRGCAGLASSSLRLLCLGSSFLSHTIYLVGAGLIFPSEVTGARGRGWRPGYSARAGQSVGWLKGTRLDEF